MLVITNEKQYSEAIIRFRRLRSKMEELRFSKNSNPFTTAQLKMAADELKSELTQYENLAFRRISIEVPSRIEGWPAYLMKHRIRSGIPQYELAERLGISRRQLYRYEVNMFRGMRLMQLIDLERILFEWEREQESVLEREKQRLLEQEHA